jgi:PDZ domain
VKLQLGLFVLLIGFGLGLGLLIRDRLSQATHAQLVMTGNSAELPFEDYGGHLYLQGKINGDATQDLILDSGAADLFVSDSQAKALKLSPQSAKIPNLSWSLGGVTLQDRNSAVLSKTEGEGLEQYFGRRMSGIIGYELFEQLVVEVDFQRHTLVVHRPQTYQYSGKGQRIPLLIEDDRPYINATITPYGYPARSGKLMVDLGSNAALSLTAGCGFEQKLIAAAPRTLHRNLATIKGSNEIVLGRVQTVQFGAIQIQQPTAIFGKTEATEDCDRLNGKIGYQILRQFKVILDYPHRQLILETPQAVPPPTYDYDLSGLWLEASGPQLNRYKVGAVTKKTPAQSAGVKIGDEIIAINNRAVSGLTLVQVRQTLSQAGQEITLHLARKTKPITVRLLLQPLL